MEQLSTREKIIRIINKILYATFLFGPAITTGIITGKIMGIGAGFDALLSVFFLTALIWLSGFGQSGSLKQLFDAIFVSLLFIFIVNFIFFGIVDGFYLIGAIILGAGGGVILTKIFSRFL